MAYRTNVKSRLEQHVQTLDQLNSALHLLEELRDMENKIDDVYLPIETMYDKLRCGTTLVFSLLLLTVICTAMDVCFAFGLWIFASWFFLWTSISSGVDDQTSWQ